MAVIAKPFADLADAGAKIAEAQQQAHARFESQKQFAQTRMELLVSARAELQGNLQRFVDKIRAVAPGIDMSERRAGFEIRLGGALLEVQLGSTTPLEVGIFRESEWDVIGNATIAVGQQKPEYVWQASLWYTKLRGGTDYRWYEASYWEWQAERYQPFALGPDRDADYAASNKMHSVNLAFGPAPIDGENEEEFHSRWAHLFSMASEHQLRQPSSLPIRGWPP